MASFRPEVRPERDQPGHHPLDVPVRQHPCEKGRRSAGLPDDQRQCRADLHPGWGHSGIMIPKTAGPLLKIIEKAKEEVAKKG